MRGHKESGADISLSWSCQAVVAIGAFRLPGSLLRPAILSLPVVSLALHSFANNRTKVASPSVPCVNGNRQKETTHAGVSLIYAIHCFSIW